MTTLQASPLAIKIAETHNRKRAEALARVAREIEADRKRQERERAVMPTPERLAKGDVGQHIIRGEGRKFRTKSPVEHYSGQWPSDIEHAFVNFIRDAHTKDRECVTISYNGNGGGSGHGRIGGLGDVQKATRDAYERFHWVRDRLTIGALQVLDWLVLELRNDPAARSLNLEDAGARLFPSIKDKATRRGIAIGRLLGAGDELAALYRKFRVLSHEPKPQMKEINP